MPIALSRFVVSKSTTYSIDLLLTAKPNGKHDKGSTLDRGVCRNSEPSVAENGHLTWVDTETSLESFGQDFSAVIIGASGGIGSAFMATLAEQSACSLLIGLSRSSSPQIDLENEDSIKAAADHIMREHHTVDLIIDATGALSINEQGPEKSLSAINQATMAKSFAVNAIGPALLLKHFVELLPKDRRGVFATLSARVGSIGDNKLGGWYSYRASKAALNQIVRCAAIEIARKRPEAVCLCLHPGTVPTRLSDPYARSDTHSAKEAAHRLLAVIDASTPDQSGTMLAYDGSAIPW